MSALTESPRRQTVPRWRSFHDSVKLGLLVPLEGAGREESRGSIDLTGALHTWRREKTAGGAGDLLGRAYVEGNSAITKEVANWVANKVSAPPALREFAVQAALKAEESALPQPEELDQHERSRRVRLLRCRLRHSPREAATWMDLAREYVALGQLDSAQQPIRIALGLAPQNRWILRSASRYYLHLHDPERARYIVSRSQHLFADPWLMAAEIASSALAGLNPRSVRQARRLLGSQRYHVRHYSELATVIGTLELEAGSHKVARRHFATGLIDPTENAVAQVEWASRRDSRIELPGSALRVPRTFEASAWNSLIEEQWPEAVQAARLWLADEPFSARAAVFGSWTSIVANGDYRQAVEFARAGLRTTPGQPVLLNNLVVALANLGELESAQRELAKIPESEPSDRHAIAHTATRGLLSYRLGDAEGGKILYMRAAALAEEAKDHWMEVLAILHHAREAGLVDRVLQSQLMEEAARQVPLLSLERQNLARRFSRISGLHGL